MSHTATRKIATERNTSPKPQNGVSGSASTTGAADVSNSSSRAIGSARIGPLDQRGGEQRDHNFMMAGERVAASTRQSVGPLDDVDAWPIVLQKIEIHGSEVAQVMAQIADAGDGLQEDFRHYHRGARVDVDSAAIEPCD